MGRTQASISNVKAWIWLVCALLHVFPSTTPPAGAAFLDIVKLQPQTVGARSPRISGLAFDGGQYPWIIDGLSWQMTRLNTVDGSAIQAYAPAIPSYGNRSLAWNPDNGKFYTMADQTYLAAIDIAAHTRVPIPGSVPLFNFLSLAFDRATGELWLGTDRNGGELWSVNQQTGAATFQTAIIGLGGQLTSLAIDDNGSFFVSARIDTSLGVHAIYSIDPGTSVASFVTSSSTNGADHIVAFDIEPISRRWFAVLERRSTDNGFYFGELIGIPESTTMSALLTFVLPLLTLTRGSKRK